mmetsp:Transcript_17357/g.43859  ORF Transcript_17357/g.43859 Transcript_17357/m.43859 type:complete len:190 (+) Transcript_17357:141-710(+)|eukprot:CAMPEP_0173465306 /NCGR_PEP_ID=MMETSP1357-20121228/71401_1 /TAXON_ID=77926 /ORGANISM="Hemiselmis rufescens, Strain PCC563" /LENGTH=189 /DNA_ID=CAMNT_0014433281 /DNA_START=106 /DNA_END=675 /DNA_ORIENTATION=-
MKTTTTVLMLLGACQAAAAFTGGLRMPRSGRTPAMLRGRSAPQRPLGDTPRLRMSETLPPGCGIDPATGELCPGDPSLILTTSVSLGDKKKAFMKAASKAVAKGLGKPESYVAICVNDGADIIWGGEEAPCALACCYSLGAINQDNNAAVTKEITALLKEFDVAPNKIYINFFDVPAGNIGYNSATFAG